LKTAWGKLEETQDEYVLELHEADKSDETDKINKEFSDLEIDKEKIVEAGEKLAPKSFVKDEPDEQRQNVAHGSKPKGTLAILKDVVENVGSTVSNLLGSIHVSKKKFQEFQTSMNDMLVSKWDEKSETKVFHGVEIAHYTRFIDMFQKNTGITDEVRALLETMEFTDKMDDKVKTFTCDGTDTEGKYGMYMALKRPQEEKVDVAYAMYTYKAEFAGSSTAKPNQYKIYNTEQASNGLHRLTTPVVEDVLTGKLMEPDRFLRKADVDELAENFIVTKALMAFAHSGTIPRVTYVEEKEPEASIEDITDKS